MRTYIANAIRDRNAGQTVANTFRTFADKEVVDYADKEKKFSKKAVKNMTQYSSLKMGLQLMQTD